VQPRRGDDEATERLLRNAAVKDAGEAMVSAGI
jgi:hypothetical protein